LALIGALVILFVISHHYNLKIKREAVELRKNDQQHEIKHSHNEQRIKKLEEKNGKELKEIEALKAEISTLKGVIETITKRK